MKQANIFLNTRSLTSSKEDHLTEFLAALIMMDESFKVKFSELLLSNYAQKKGWDKPKIAVVETQVNFTGTNCCPDMRFTLSDGNVILCENKIEALETQGSASDPRGQLIRYLDLPADGLVYIRATPSHSLAREVAEHPKFITNNGHHFLWRDIYPLLENNDNPLVGAVRKGFEMMGFMPPVPAVGTLSGFNSSEDEKNRQQFKPLWQLAAEYGQQQGWKAETNKNAELYYGAGNSKNLYQVFASPSKAERFLIRLTLKNGVRADRLMDKIAQVATDVPFESLTYTRKSPRGDEKIVEEVIDITTSLRNVIGDTVDKQKIQQLLSDFVTGFVNAVA